jgi:DNA transformation protein and related proteins
MPVTPAYREFVLEPLRRVAPVTARGMFGGVGLHSDGLFFGLLDDDRSYLKTDALTRASQKDAGAEPFRPSGGGSPMQYYELAPSSSKSRTSSVPGWRTRSRPRAAPLAAEPLPHHR